MVVDTAADTAVAMVVEATVARVATVAVATVDLPRAAVDTTARRPPAAEAVTASRSLASRRAPAGRYVLPIRSVWGDASAPFFSLRDIPRVDGVVRNSSPDTEKDPSGNLETVMPI